ncbi:MAG TPA: M1 family aminopeptidase, partial [Polyangiaceae bacterium]
RASLAALVALTRLQVRETVKNVFFLVILLAGVLFVVATGMESDQLFGTKTWPVTYEVLEVVGGNFSIFILVIIAFYSGELVWRERDAGLAPIMDALPTARWVTFTSKLLALMFVQVLLAAILLASGMGLQAAKGYFHFEPLVYLKTLFGVKLLSFWFLCALAFFVHVALNNKYVGHFLIVLYFIVGILLPLMGLEHYLYRIGSIPSWKYSDMNGFGHFARQIALYQLYWGALAVVLAVASNALWVRGAEAGLRARLRAAWASRSRSAAALAGASLVVFVAAGAAIFWNTDVVTRFRTQHETEAGQARWEKTYAKWGDVPQPKVRAAKVDCDLFPEDRRAVLRGTYAIENATDAPMGQVIVRVHPDAEIGKFSFGRGEHASVSDPSLGFFVYDLAQPLAPHAKAALDFEVAFHEAGFSTSDVSKNLVENGTFFNSTILPHIGYSAELELADDAVRHKYGLAPRHMAPAGDPKESLRNAITEDADWVDFEATVSTSADQKAFAPGYLEREWTEGDRRYFHYVMDSKIFNLFGFLSGRYAVKRDHWSPPPRAMPGSKDVDIEIDYHPGHEFDLDRMVHGAKQSLDYFTTNFGPYQHHQVRIIEFPRYDRFAESLPNTIPFSEAIGFIARVDDSKPDDIDYPFYVTAHEVAHQWWAHQVISANVQGATFLSETMAQYSALMVMKHEYGADKMKRFLRYELDRYLRGRSGAKRAELPLLRVENQPYIHYGKGSVVMYAFQDYVGEERLNAVLAKFVAETKFQAPPYTDARAFVAALREATPPEYPHLVEDLFETITLFENRATKATYARRPDGKYDVEIAIEAKKLRADEFGAETEIPLDDFIDVGVVDKDGKAILLERRKITEKKATFTVTVDQEPAKAGIDPMNKLVDRMPEDNVITVEKKEGA